MRALDSIRRLIGLNSLRGRYRVVALGMALLVVFGIWVAEDYVGGVGRTATENMAERNDAVLLSRHIRDDVWQAELTLHSFMLAPDIDQRHAVHRHLQRAIRNAGLLARSPWVARSTVARIAREAGLNLEQLNDLADRLMGLRGDPDHLFPAMRILNEEMEPANRDFLSATALALEELADDEDFAGYRRFSETRQEWLQLIIALRIYLINITGAFGDSLSELQKAQEAQVRFRLQRVNERLVGLGALEEKHGFGMQASASLAVMREQASHWAAGYEQASEIYRGTQWRTDVPLIKDSVQPLFSSIQGNLQAIDQVMERAAALDVGSLNRVAGGITHSLWAIIVTAIALFILAFLYFEKTVLSPIALVAQALRSEARGRRSAELPVTDATETHALVEAFAEMRRQVHQRQRQLEYQAGHDALTGLPNRSRLMERLAEALESAKGERQPLALLVMDLNRFKEINDTLGHEIGDQLLQQVRNRLLNTVDEAFDVVRLGGDEFAVLMPGTGRERAVAIAAEITEALAQVFTVEMHTLFVGGGLGIALFPEHGDDNRTLIQHAEVAMYVAKRNNHHYAVYDIELDQHSIRRLALESDLHHAIGDGQLELYFQPKVNLTNGQTTGVEALIRWHHPERGFIPPDELIAVAEQTGLIKPLTAWVLETGMGQRARWQRIGIEVQVAVNLSVWNLQDPELVTQIRDGLDRHRLPAHALGLEITESAMMADPERALAALVELDAMGISLAVDDFGTGFSSLSYLKRLPVDELKIDKSFVMSMNEDENDAAIVRSTIDLAHNLGLKVVAEGVENQQIWTVLEFLGCDTAQGYYMSRPIPAADFEQWYQQNLWLKPEPQRLHA
ncbi:putative bifunctional diguanylate cyclase/phosphodiesterase [Endothiovibrio diazotrophicus]